MTYRSIIARKLHDEHMQEVALLERLANLLRLYGPAAPPPAEDGEAQRLISELSRAFKASTQPHMEFEEQHLFPRLADLGEGDIGALLTSEHAVISDVGERLAYLAGEATDAGFTASGWSEFRRLGLEFVERLMSHIQKEEMGLLPMIEEMLDSAEDSDLTAIHLAAR